MTIGVSLNGKHCLNDLGMYLTKAEIGQPKPQTTFLTVPGRDGPLDLSEALDGTIHYQEREISLTFESTPLLSGKTWPVFLSDLSNLVHGVISKIAFDDDGDYYYTGRGEVSDFGITGNKYSITMGFICDPYKTSSSDGSKSL